MKKLFLLPLAMMLFGCLPGQEPRQIIVNGEAMVEAMPDIFEVSASIKAQGETHAETLSEIAAVYAKLNEDLLLLEGLEKLNISTSQASVSPIYDYDCQENIYDEDQCPITGYVGSISVSLEGAPATIAGSMISYVSELGATSVELDAFRASNREELEQNAISAAVENAREKAKLIAAASGSTITGTIKIQYGDGFPGGLFSVENDMLVVTGTRMARAPLVTLDIEPQPVRIRAEIAAAFAIE